MTERGARRGEACVIACSGSEFTKLKCKESCHQHESKIAP